jgi:hypothetical protein
MLNGHYETHEFSLIFEYLNGARLIGFKIGIYEPLLGHLPNEGETCWGNEPCF